MIGRRKLIGLFVMAAVSTNVVPALAQWPGPGGRRGEICAISPRESAEIWSDRPFFKWQRANLLSGAAAPSSLQIIVRDKATRAVLWQQSLSADAQSINYGGQIALQPGQAYQWQVAAAEPQPDDWFPFQLLNSAQRDAITNQLQQIQASGSSASEIALKQAEYLTSPELKMDPDALQILHAVSNPSAAVTQKIQEIEGAYCQ